MGRLFPALNPEEIKNPGERAVARVLIEQLPRRVEIFHSFNWLAKDRRGTIREGECDFLLLDRERGVLFVEVKGGSLVFDGQQWVRDVRGETRILNKDPFAQATQCMHQIIKLVKRQFTQFGGDLPFTYGTAVAFPDCQVAGRLPPSIHPELVLDARRLRTCEISVRRVFESFKRAHHRALFDREVESVREALYPRYQLVPVVWRKIEDQEARLRRLTEEQHRLLDYLANQPKAAIRGVAGSGKTMLALAKAQREARAGRRTLLLCYNRPLQDWLKAAVPESFATKLVVLNYHSLVNRLCMKAGVPLWERGDQKDRHFWDVQAAEALLDACDLLGPEHKFDTIVVDEGQDFREFWWTSLDAVFRSSGSKACYYVFYDPKQNLYVEDPALPPELGRPYELPVNCRNTVRIAAHCASLAGYENRFLDGAPLGEEPVVVQVRTTKDAYREAGRQVRQLCQPGQGGLTRSQVAVLVPSVSGARLPARFGTVPLTQELREWSEEKGVLITSWKRFKGLEADAVVILEQPSQDGNSSRANVHRYVARSRAKHLLTVIEVHE
ncbi:MAG: NERD domain-containing protein [Bryobacterales bacterium]|nr:NERD domain-containing protein [Bryobacterales bacterium]